MIVGSSANEDTFFAGGVNIRRVRWIVDQPQNVDYYFDAHLETNVESYSLPASEQSKNIVRIGERSAYCDAAIETVS